MSVLILFRKPIVFQLLLLLCLCDVSPAYAQQSTRSLTARYIDQEIVLDGHLDEAVWAQVEKAENFWQFFPTDSLRSDLRTDVYILYDETTLYVGIYAESAGDNYVVSTLRRDFGGSSNDNVSVIFDTFSDGTNAFLFGVTPYGVQREVQISDGGASANGFNTSWDMKWKAESQRYPDHYTVELAIPFTSVKFKEGVSSWRFQTYRWDIQTNEQSAWERVPQNQLLSNLAFMGELKFEKPLGKSRTPLALIPYVNLLNLRDFSEEVGSETSFKAGGDAKVSIGNSMNLDLTYNPDFSNVEVDNIFTNLTRFEVFLPEKRQFFIDNSDLFGNFGSDNDEIPFFSRRIGLARDTTGNLIENPIIAGARLSGKLNQNLRLGFLNIQTAEDVANGIPSNNNMMLSLQQKVFSRSNIGFFFINRQSFREYEFLEEGSEFNRVTGIDYNLASADNVWSGKFYVHKSFQPGDSKGNLSTKAYLVYNTRYWRFAADLVYIDEEFQSDLGFVPRRDIFKNGLSALRNFYPSASKINRHGIRLLGLNYWRPGLDFKNTDHDYRLTWESDFRNQSTVEATLRNQYIFLTSDFDPTGGEGAVPIPGNTGYNFSQVSLSYTSNPSRLFQISAASSAGEFFNGNIFSANAELSFRAQPWAVFSVSANYDGIRLPDPHSDADFWLISPKIDITFTKSIFWSTLIQYSNQRDNVGINSRLQWRFAPLSDLFLVYNDNYTVDGFTPKFRSINLKVSYWLNI